jgi:hypothetical protein
MLGRWRPWMAQLDSGSACKHGGRCVFQLLDRFRGGLESALGSGPMIACNLLNQKAFVQCAR